MASPDEFIAAFDVPSESASATGGHSAADFLSAFDTDSYAPPIPLSSERQRRKNRLSAIREFSKAGDDESLNRMFAQPAPGRAVTMLAGDRMVPVEDTLFADLPLPLRSAISGAAAVGAAIENPILRMTGRGAAADKNRRNLENLRAFNRELNKNSVLGSTVGPVVGDVADALTAGTLTAPLGGSGATGSLAAVSTAFGVDGADRAYVQARDAGVPDNEAGVAAAKQFLIDGALTFVGGKLVQSLGLNPGRYLGSVAGRASQQAAEKSGLTKVIGSGLADASINGIQGGMTYLNEVFTGLHDFDIAEFATTTGMSAAVGGVAGATTAGIPELTHAWERFRTEMPKAVAGAKDANTFIETADPATVAKALAAESASSFADATGQKGQGPLHREAFQEELQALIDLQTELESKGVETRQSLEQSSKELQRRREAVESRAQEFEGAPPEAEAGRTVERQAEVEKIREQVEGDRKAIAEEQETLDVLRRTIEGEELQHRAYLESELDRLATEETVKGKDAPEVLMAPPERQHVPKSIAEQYDGIDTAIQDVGRVSADTHKGGLPDDAGRKDLGRLIDQHVEGRENRVSMFNALAKAKTPGQVRDVANRLAKHLHNSELRLAKRDFEDAQSKAKGLREEQQKAVQQAVDGVNRQNVDSVREAADRIREATYQSMTADTLLASETNQRVSETVAQIEQEVGRARPLTMKSDSPVRKILGDKTPGLEITRDYFTLDSPVFREWAARPEVQMARLSEKLRETIYEPLGVEGQARLDLADKEVNEGLSGVLEHIGLPNDASLDATLGNIATRGRGTDLNRWKTEQRTIDGVRLSRQEAALIFHLGMDPSNAAALEAKGFVFPDGRKFNVIDERINNQLVDFIGDEGLQISEWMLQYGNGPLIDRVNDAKRRVSGRPLTTRKDVVPRVVDNNALHLTDDPLKALQDYTLTSYRHLRRRTAADAPLTIPEGTRGIFDYFLNHSERMNRVAAFLPAARDAQLVLNNPEVRRAIKAADGKQGLDNLMEAVRIQTVGARRPKGVEASIARANALNAAATLGARLSTMLIQGTSTIASAAYKPRGIRDFLRTLPAVLGRSSENGTQARMEAVLGEHSGHYWRRYNARGYASEASGGVYTSRDRFSPPSLAEHALRPLQETERVVNSVARFAQAELTAQRAGLDPSSPEWGPAVAREWERLTYRGENTSQGMELSGVLRAGRESPTLGVLATFQNTASKIYSLFPRAFDLMDKGRYLEGIGVLAVAAAAQLPVAIIREALTHSKKKDDLFLEAAGNRAIQDLASLHPLGSISLVPLIRALQGQRSFFSGPALLNNITEATLAVGEFGKGLLDAGEQSADPKAFAEKLYEVALPLATLSGLPVEGVDDFRRRIEKGTMFPGLDRASTGDAAWGDMVDILQLGEVGQGGASVDIRDFLPATGE